jgi:hypothetical protein
MTDRFGGVWLKVSRARQHIDNLESAIIAFHNTGPYEVVTVDDPQTGKRIARIGSEPAPIPDEVPLILGDAVHVMRSSLDHFLYAAIPNPTQDTAFPVCRRGVPTAAYWKSLVGGKTKGASKQLRQALLALQPFEGGCDHSVWLIDRLDLVDKHNLVLTTGVAYSAMTFDIAAFLRAQSHWTKDLPTFPISLRPADRYPVEKGTELFIADPADFEKHEGLKFSFDVAFGEPQALIGEPVVPTLRRLVVEVETLLKRLIPLV